MKSGTVVGATFAQNAYYYNYQNELYFAKEKTRVSAYKAFLYAAVNGCVMVGLPLRVSGNALVI